MTTSPTPTIAVRSRSRAPATAIHIPPVEKTDIIVSVPSANITPGQQAILDAAFAKPKAKGKAKKGEAAEPVDAKPKTELEAIMGEIRDKKGPKTVFLGTQLPLFNLVSTGAFTLDLALLGGVSEGQCAMFYGWENSGKTTMLLRVVASLQRKHPDKVVVWVDAETTLDRDWAVKHGVDLQRLVILQPESGEDAVDMIKSMLDTWEVCGVVVDSIPALVPQKQSDRSAADNAAPAELARLVGFMCSDILKSWVKERKRGHWVTVLLANQFRSKITMFGDPRSIPGGNQLKYLVTTRVELKNKEVGANEAAKGKDADATQKEAAKKAAMDCVSVNEHTFKITKAKLTSIRAGEFQMVVDPEHPLGMGTFLDAPVVVAFAKKMGIVQGGGSSWRVECIDEFDGMKFGNLAAICDALYQEPVAFLELKRHIIGLTREAKGMPYLPPDNHLIRW